MEKCATYDSICRVCLKQNKHESMVSLQEKPERRSLITYGKVLLKFAKITIDYDDILPTKICQSCKKQIQNFNTFKLMCKNNDRKLRKFVNLAQNDSEKCVQMISEYSIFSQYFPREDLKIPYSNLSASECNPIQSSTNYCDIDNYMPFEETPTECNSMKSVDLFLDSIEKAVSTAMTYKKLAQKKKAAKKIDQFLNSIEKAVDIKAKQSSLKCKVKPYRIRQIFHCDICNRTLGNRFTYNYHMQRHTKYQFICDQCGKGFPGKVPLHRHLVKTHDTGPYLQCNHCPFKCSKRFDLVEHVRIHTGERPFTCDKCGLTFRRRAIWTNHLVQHQDKTVPCNICQKKFHRQCELTFHVNSVHERLYVYLCSLCNATYATNKTVRKHMLSKHGVPRDKQGKIMRIPNNPTLMMMEKKMG